MALNLDLVRASRLAQQRECCWDFLRVRQKAERMGFLMDHWMDGVMVTDLANY